MKKIPALLLFLLLNGYLSFLPAQGNKDQSAEFPLATNDADHPCISPEEYQVLEQRCAQHVALLGLTPVENSMITLLNWPLRAANGLSDCNYAAVSAYVDQNTSTGAISDYNCGTKTYDGHKGTDISIWPFPFYKMDHDQVEVIAAAAGTIVDKQDGNFDKNCAANNMNANYLVVQHADGSRALYFHMKKNSLTSKAIGQSVALGEYLGVVGSSGNSSGPHLHFEVWSGSTVATRIDPFAGACNSLNQSSWWAAQKPYASQEILKASVHTTDAVLPTCPETETPNESTCYLLPFQGPGLPTGAAKFYIFTRYETAGAVTNLSILNPDGSVFSSWTYTSVNTSNAGVKSWTKPLPAISGTYTFKAELNGVACLRTFDVVSATITAGGPTTFCQGGSVTLTASPASSYAWSNGATTQAITVSSPGDYRVTISTASACSAVSNPVTVTVNPAPSTPVITAGGSTTFCEGGSVILTASAANSYVWNNGATTQAITISNTGDYTVTVTNATACSAVSNATAVTVNPLPSTPIITAGGSTTFCEGGSVILTASAANSYVWNNGATTQAITVSNTGNYTVTVTNATACSAVSNAAAVTVNPLPSTPAITAGGPTTFCEGGSVILTASAANSYVWNNGATTQAITVSNTGNYTVTVTDVTACSAVSNATAVTVNPAPASPVITVDGTTLLSDHPSGNQWYLNGVPIPNATASSYAPTQNGDYTLVFTDQNGCSAASEVLHFISTGIISITEGGPMQILPNPNEGVFMLTLKREDLRAEPIAISVYNGLGECILASRLLQPMEPIDLSAQPNGMYMVKAKGANWTQILTMIKI